MWERIAGQLCASAIDWGPGLILAIIMLFGLFKLIKNVGLKVVAALEKPAGALSQQAQSMDRLTNSIQDYVNRDQSDHKEIIILQKVIREELKDIRVSIEEKSWLTRERKNIGESGEQS